MVDKICHISKFGSTYILHPRSSDLLENNCLDKSTHLSYFFRKDYIFDLRKEIINCKNNDFYFYIILFNDKMEEICISNNNINNSTIYHFNREKLKNSFKNKFKYTYLVHHKKMEIIKTSKNNLIYLGESKNINKNDLAWEIPLCFKNKFSNKGNGFFGFTFELNDVIEEPKYALLVSFNSKFDSLVPQLINSNYSEPSAPPMEL